MELLIYFIFFVPRAEIPGERAKEEIPEEFMGDKIAPLTLVKFPPDKSWHNTDFEATIYDSDLGGSELVSFIPEEKGCRYIIEDLGTGNNIGGYRKCDPTRINVPVGKGKICSSSYQKDFSSQGKCKVSTMAYDNAGNSSGWKSRVFNIDLIEPKVGELPQTITEPDELQIFEVSISDNSKITGCWFLVNDELQETEVKLNPVPCKDGLACKVKTNYAFASEGDYNVRFICSDIAGNYGYGNSALVEVITNHPPKISSCKVSPTQGTTQTEFQFKVGATDPDGDTLNYNWNFGDGEKSEEKDPTHYYSLIGTFEPRVVVVDGRGGEVGCSTAWVTVIKE